MTNDVRNQQNPSQNQPSQDKARQSQNPSQSGANTDKTRTQSDKF